MSWGEEVDESSVVNAGEWAGEKAEAEFREPQVVSAVCKRAWIRNLAHIRKLHLVQC